MTLLPESYVVTEDFEQDSLIQDFNQENYRLQKELTLAREENDGLKWELNKANEQIISLSAERDNETTEKLLFEIKCRLKVSILKVFN